MKVVISETGDVQKTLAEMPVILQTELGKALRKGGNEQAKAARRYAPKPGYPGDKPGLMPLKNTIRTVVKHYAKSVVAVVGPKWPEGAHGHLVEFGHEITRTTPGPTRTRPVPFMRQAADDSLRDQQAAIVKYLKGNVEKLA